MDLCMRRPSRLPLLVRHGVARMLDGPHGPPINATEERTRYRESATPLEAGDLLALYSDGLIERRGVHR